MIQAKHSNLLSKEDLIIFASKHLMCAPERVKVELKQKTFFREEKAVLSKNRVLFFCVCANYPYQWESDFGDGFTMKLRNDFVLGHSVVVNADCEKSRTFDMNVFFDELSVDFAKSPMTFLYYEFTVI